MTTLREAAQQALEALELALSSYGVMLLSNPPQDAWKTRGVESKSRLAITALRAALEQPEREQEQEPVAHVKVRPLQGDEWQRKVEITWVGGPFTGPLYTHPPRRTWQSLTEEERRECTASPFVVDNYRAIEYKLKELNHHE